ncbi:FAD-dependent oxidoreductase [Roseiflexus sp.]|uniref:oxidoreductase n=1 Tax=Roseiflexus sp. TaxID=2562120 RepID=UPI00398B8CDB
MTPMYDILFEPVRIGPVVAPNRFYQVPHCNGMGYRMPRALAEMRRVKAEGGWGVVCTEEVEIHYSSDLAPYAEGRLWSDDDIPALALMAEEVHRHGALAGIELTHNGHNALNYYSRTPSLGPRSMGLMGGTGFEPGQCRRVDREDIRNLRRWHRNAALRAKRAGFDIIYCYAGHGLSLAMHFLLRRFNDRTDEYGGSLANRVRLFRELIEDTKDAVGDRCAVAVRLAVDELLGEEGLSSQGEGYDIVAMLAELPDLWDVNVSDWSNDSASSRFEKEGFQEPYIAFVKQLTSKPVVGVGRYTSPESMVSAVRRGVLDLIGSARPSIADPFLPRKIQEGRVEDIRECIGCNICVSSDNKVVPIRCTQNPTMGEEWRRGWHPETIPPKRSDAEILVVGAGPAGLECARALGQRGYRVTLAEAQREPGGRVAREARLPGLSEWRRVIDWRLTQIARMPNVHLLPGNPLTSATILESGYEHVIIATGAVWRRDGVGRTVHRPVPGSDAPHVYTPDDLMDGRLPVGRVVIYDDDHYYMGGVLAELLARQGCDVVLCTPAPLVSHWSQFTLEQKRIERRLRELGVALHTRCALSVIRRDAVTVVDTVTRRLADLSCDAVVIVADRIPRNDLVNDLASARASGHIRTLRVIGDADAPHIIAQAVFAGHLAAREFDDAPDPDVPPFLR